MLAIGILLLLGSFFLDEGTNTQTAIISGVLFIVCATILDALRYVYMAITELQNKEK